MRCSTRTNSRGCDNRPTIRTGEIEARVLATQQQHPLASDVVAAAVNAHHEERQKLAARRRRRQGEMSRELAAINHNDSDYFGTCPNSSCASSVTPRPHPLVMGRGVTVRHAKGNTMSKISHAPLPWEQNDAGLIYGQTVGDDDEAPFVADVIANRERAAFGILTDVECANANLIVTACNTHFDFVAALEAFVDDIDSRLGELPEDCEAYHRATTVLARLSRETTG